MVCDQCQALFRGEVTRTVHEKVAVDRHHIFHAVYEKRDQHCVSQASSNGCRLCHTIRARLRRNIRQPNQVQQEDQSKADVLIDRQLRFVTWGNSVQCFLTGFLAGSSEEAYLLQFSKSSESFF